MPAPSSERAVAWKSSNPALSESALERWRKAQGVSSSSEDAGVMTINGTINKTGVLLLLLVASSAVGWNVAATPGGPAIAIGATVLNLVLFFVISFRPRLSPVLAPAYALVEGIAIGAISRWYSDAQPGIVTHALAATFGILGAMLVLYRTGILRASERLRSVLTLATLGILIVYLGDLALMAFAGTRAPFVHESSPVGIAFSLGVVAVAALTFTLDFDAVERMAAARVPRHMEWYGAFALVLTIVWLYLEVLRLLSKLNRK